MLPASPRRSWPTSLLLGAPSLIPRGILRPFVAPAHDVSPLAHSLPLYLSTSSRHTQQTQKPKPLAPHEQSAREHNTHHHVPNSNDTVSCGQGPKRPPRLASGLPAGCLPPQRSVLLELCLAASGRPHLLARCGCNSRSDQSTVSGWCSGMFGGAGAAVCGVGLVQKRGR